MCENPQLLCIVLPALRTGEALWVYSTWDLRPIGDRFESHPEGSVYSYHRQYQSMSMLLLVEGCLGHFYIFF